MMEMPDEITIWIDKTGSCNFQKSFGEEIPVKYVRADLMDREKLVKAIKILDTAVYDFQRNQVRDILIGLLAGNTMIGDKP